MFLRHSIHWWLLLSTLMTTNANYIANCCVGPIANANIFSCRLLLVHMLYCFYVDVCGLGFEVSFKNSNNAACLFCPPATFVITQYI